MTQVKVSGTGIKSTNVTATAADTTIYVRAAGSDTNDGLTTGTALATIQEAVDRIPAQIFHNVVIDIGAGDFAGFYIEGHEIFGQRYTESSLTIKGTMGLPTLSTGTNTGTSDGGGVGYLDDSGQSWTPGELVGFYLGTGVTTEGGDRITANTATRITVASVFTFGAGTDYTINSATTRIVSPSADPRASGYYLIDIVDVYANKGVNSLECNFLIEQLYLDCDEGNYDGVYHRNSRSGMFKYIQMLEPYFGFTIDRVEGTTEFEKNFIFNYDASGYYINECENVSLNSVCVATEIYEAAIVNNVNRVDIVNCWFEGYAGSDTIFSAWNVNYIYISVSLFKGSNFGSGIKLSNVTFAEIASNNDIIENDSYGIVTEVGGVYSLEHPSTQLIFTNSPSTISDNGDGGIFATNGVRLLIKNNLAGTGNGNFGIELQTGATCILQTGSLTITGNAGDATINGKTTELTWTTDFASDGDTVANPSNGCKIERKD